MATESVRVEGNPRARAGRQKLAHDEFCRGDTESGASVCVLIAYGTNKKVVNALLDRRIRDLSPREQNAYSGAEAGDEKSRVRDEN